MGGLVKMHAAQVLLCSDGEAVAVGRRQEGQCAVPASRPSVAVGYRSLNNRIFGYSPAGCFLIFLFAALQYIAKGRLYVSANGLIANM